MSIEYLIQGFDDGRTFAKRPVSSRERDLDCAARRSASSSSSMSEFGESRGVRREWLLDQERNAAGEEFHAYSVMRMGRRGDDRGVDFTDQLAIIGDGTRAGLGGDRIAALGHGVGDRDQFEVGNTRGDAGVDAAQVARADDGQA